MNSKASNSWARATNQCTHINTNRLYCRGPRSEQGGDTEIQESSIGAQQHRGRTCRHGTTPPSKFDQTHQHTAKRYLQK